MIRFQCQCGHQFQEPDNAAGVAVQCPACLLLSDVPSAGAGEQIGLDDSTDNQTAGQSPYALDQLTADASNDQREPGTAAAGTEDTGDDATTIPLVYRRKFSAEIPFAKRVITYQADGIVQPYGLPAILLDLLRPANLFVLFCVLVFHCVALALLAGIVVKLLFVLPVVAFLVIAILAHYGNVIEEIGLESQNELPRLMRDLRLNEDFLWPLTRIISAVLLSFGPALAVLFLPIEKATARSVFLALLAAGTFLFPAITLTLQTSGSIANLRPDRILGVIIATHARYLASVLMFAAAATAYVIALFSLTSDMLAQIGIAVPQITGKLLLSLPLLCIAIYLMHAFCWQLGILHRFHGPRFPWTAPYAAPQSRPPLERKKRRYFMPGPVEAGTEGKMS